MDGGAQENIINSQGYPEQRKGRTNTKNELVMVTCYWTMLPRVTDISQAEKGFNLEINAPISHTLCLVE